MRHRLAGLVLALTLFSASNAHAASVVVWGETIAFNLNTINTFYNSLPGVTSILAGGTLDTVNLAGVGLLWATQPADAYTAAELAAMANFIAGGGRIAFMGEHGTFAPDQNNRINAALSYLGATIQIQNSLNDPQFRTASVADGQILANPLTAGVNTYTYAAFAPLLVSGTAQKLMLGEDDPLSVMMAYQNIGPGSVFLITDQNVWDGSPTWGGIYDNGTMFANLLLANTGAPPVDAVPEPTSLLLLGTGVLGLIRSRRRQ